MKFLFTILFFFSYLVGFSQIYPAGKLNVIENGNTLKNPWGGGFDLPQFSASDIDGDGKKDLVVFDKKGNKWLIYLKKSNGDYIYAPQYEKLFPEIINLGLIRDYNCDGYGDIFAHVNQGIQVFKNTHQGGNPSFELVKSIIKYEASFGSNNIYKYNNDIPAIEDFDGDGDMDILSFDLLGTTIPFYRNLSVENGFGCDSLVYEENTVCWGHFKESNTDNSIQLNFSCKGNSGTEISSANGGNDALHTGSTLAVLDEDEDGDQDLLLGDVAFNNLIFLRNGGTNTTANMTSVEDNFPAYNTSIDVPIFPASFYIDVDGDDLKDLLVSPNALASSVNKDCVWYYKNTGNANNRFQLEQKNFLVETQIDKGSYSNVTFFDHNADGLQDMIVGNGFVYDAFGNSEGALFYYENTGTATHPEFTLKNDNYAFAGNFGLEYLKPCFGDLDGDGDDDMLLGEANGSLILFTNNAGAGNEASLGFTSINYFDIDVGNHSSPQLVDINNDGLLDLIVGRNAPKGNVAYYRNIGTSAGAVFHKDTVNAVFGGIHVENPGFLFGYSAPFVTEPNTAGERFIYVGSDLGFIHKYKINNDSLESGVFEEVETAILDVRAGKRTTISVIDINNDGEQDYFVGNSRGGIHFYSDIVTDSTLLLSIDETLKNNLSFSLFPNPTKNNFTLNFENSNKEKAQIEIFNILGESIFVKDFKGNSINIHTNKFSNGVYFVRLKINDKSKTQKLVIR